MDILISIYLIILDCVGIIELKIAFINMHIAYCKIELLSVIFSECLHGMLFLCCKSQRNTVKRRGNPCISFAFTCSRLHHSDMLEYSILLDMFRLRSMKCRQSSSTMDNYHTHSFSFLSNSSSDALNLFHRNYEQLSYC